MAKKIAIVVGTRPNFIKITQFERCIAQYPELELLLIHTGQHYDTNMSDIFFSQLELKQPDYHLGLGQMSPALQIGATITELTTVFEKEQPAIVLVPGDVNSTLASAIAANKCGIKVGHIESGLRSFDREMPEEINRLAVDSIADLLFVTEPSGLTHLKHDGRSDNDVHYVGNTMIDTLVHFDDKIQQCTILDELKVAPKQYALMTMHRPSNVDQKDTLQQVVDIIESITANQQLVFPIHPRTKKNLEKYGLLKQLEANNALIFTSALDYFSFQKLISDCSFVITDSGGIQEETTYRQVPCLTLRNNTERPSTTDIGSNILMPLDIKLVQEQIDKILDGTFKKGQIPEKWDGRATERIVKVLKDL